MHNRLFNFFCVFPLICFYACTAQPQLPQSYGLYAYIEGQYRLIHNGQDRNDGWQGAQKATFTGNVLGGYPGFQKIENAIAIGEGFHLLAHFSPEEANEWARRIRLSKLKWQETGQFKNPFGSKVGKLELFVRDSDVGLAATPIQDKPGVLRLTPRDAIQVGDYAIHIGSLSVDSQIEHAYDKNAVLLKATAAIPVQVNKNESSGPDFVTTVKKALGLSPISSSGVIKNSEPMLRYFKHCKPWDDSYHRNSRWPNNDKTKNVIPEEVARQAEPYIQKCIGKNPRKIGGREAEWCMLFTCGGVVERCGNEPDAEVMVHCLTENWPDTPIDNWDLAHIEIKSGIKDEPGSLYGCIDLHEMAQVESGAKDCHISIGYSPDHRRDLHFRFSRQDYLGSIEGEFSSAAEFYIDESQSVGALRSNGVDLQGYFQPGKSFFIAGGEFMGQHCYKVKIGQFDASLISLDIQRVKCEVH